MQRVLTIFAAAALVLPLAAQEQPQQGAKSIFLNTQTGRMTMPKVPLRPSPSVPRAPAVSPPSAGSPASSSSSEGIRPVEVPAITGLMYYLELLSPNGELVQVNSNRVFRSGEKFRLHITSNIDGRLTILQSQDGGQFERLFPAAERPGLSSSMKKGVETILPSPNGWFTFDERPGQIRMLMMLAAEEIPAVNARETSSPEAMLAIESLQKGSKGLIVETSDSLKEGYEVRVVNSTQDPKVVPGQIVVEVKLDHRPRV